MKKQSNRPKTKKARRDAESPVQGTAERAGMQSNKPNEPSQFAGKTVASVFGEIVWLLSRSPEHREMKLSDLEWLVMPPLLLRQFKIYYAGQQPVAVELFARVSPQIAERIDAGEKKLLPQEWRSGELPRLIYEVDLRTLTESDKSTIQ